MVSANRVRNLARRTSQFAVDSRPSGLLLQVSRCTTVRDAHIRVHRRRTAVRYTCVVIAGAITLRYEACFEVCCVAFASLMVCFWKLLVSVHEAAPFVRSRRNGNLVSFRASANEHCDLCTHLRIDACMIPHRKRDGSDLHYIDGCGKAGKCSE
jgi:hypothetical protein